MIYKSIPVQVEAFQLVFTMQKFHQWLREKPQWFIDAFNTGQIMITHTLQYKYVTIEAKNGMQRAVPKDWIVKDATGEIFSRTPEQFKNTYEKVVDGKL